MFSWRYLDADGEERGRSEGFESRESAETWLGGTWEQLLVDGHQEVALHDDATGARVYRMGLRES
ncbi:MAG: hypothetical protein LC722_06120 [Actinobacteria bacterium]|nr:hypothetical protein [Actinomycetota bacterium]